MGGIGGKLRRNEGKRMNDGVCKGKCECESVRLAVRMADG